MIKPMKILIATGIYPPSIGGPATYSKLLFEELPKRGFEIKVISFDEVRHLPKVVRHFMYFCKVLRHAYHADVVYAQDPVSVGVPALFAARWAFKKFYLKIVGDYAWEQGTQRNGVKDNLDIFSQNKKYPFFVRLLKWTEFFVAWNAEKIIVPSNYLKKIVTNWGVRPDKIKVIYNTFEAENVPTESHEALRTKYDFHAPVITSVARLVPWKGFDMLIDVVAEIAKDIKDIKLLIMSDGPDKDRLQKKIDDLHLNDTVMLAGRLPQKELFKFIKASDVFVLNTQYEGFSHLLLEVMALGVPIVTTSVGGNVELVENNKNGLLVNYNNKKELIAAILTVLKVEGEGKRLSDVAKNTVRAFTKERMLSELVAELER